MRDQSGVHGVTSRATVVTSSFLARSVRRMSWNVSSNGTHTRSTPTAQKIITKGHVRFRAASFPLFFALQLPSTQNKLCVSQSPKVFSVSNQKRPESLPIQHIRSSKLHNKDRGNTNTQTKWTEIVKKFLGLLGVDVIFLSTSMELT